MSVVNSTRLLMQGSIDNRFVLLVLCRFCEYELNMPLAPVALFAYFCLSLFPS